MLIGLGLVALESGSDPISYARKTVEDLEACSGKTVQLHINRAYLENFDVEGEGPYGFGLGLTLRKLSEHERSVVASEQSGSYLTGGPALTFDSFAHRMTHIGWVLESRAPFPSQIVLAGEPTPHYEIYTGPPFDPVMTLFRLSGAGFPYFGLIAATPVSWLYPGKRCMYLPRAPGSQARQPYLATADHIQEIASRWNDYGRAALSHPSGWWAACLLRFNMSYGRAIAEDQLVDLCICLEGCLSNPHEMNKGKQIGARASRLLGTGAEWVPKAIEDGFMARNPILHAGSYPNPTVTARRLHEAARAILVRILEKEMWKGEPPVRALPNAAGS
jgi:hypothetical protein